jgi:phosphatidylserine/phosphatidylglycerophosphate/cardiolipin synthase-like enzyme
MKSYVLRLIALVFVFTGFGPIAYSGNAEPPLFFTPTGHGGQVEVLSALNSAKTSIHMTMYNLTDQAILDALVAAHDRGVEVKLIEDYTNASRKKGGPFDQLVSAGVDARKSSQLFSITHEKAFVIDGTKAYVMTLNLTKISDDVRDVALITQDRDNVKFVEDLFSVDWDNAANGTGNTPAVIPDNFVVAPIDGVAKITALIDSARSSLQIEVENLSYTDIIKAMIAAQARGVNVQVMLPRCNMSSSDFDMPAALQLSQGGVDVRLMPGPMTADLPYIHQKSIIVDGTKAFLGSENFSFNSLEKARELGIIFDDPKQIGQLSATFQRDFAKSLNYSDATSFTCPKSPYSDDALM